MDFMLKKKNYFLVSWERFKEYAAQDELDLKWISEVKKEMFSNTCQQLTAATPLTHKKRSSATVVRDEKENFLMPAPRGRPLRNKKRSTKSVIGEEEVTRPKRVTRSSKISQITIEEDEVVTIEKRRTRRIKASTKGSTSPGINNVELSTDGESSIIAEGAIAADGESSEVSKRSMTRQSTRKKTEKPNERVSRATRASARVSYKSRPSVSGERRSSRKNRLTKRKSSIAVDEEVVVKKRMTKNKATSLSVSGPLEVEIEECKTVTRGKAGKISSFTETEIQKTNMLTPDKKLQPKSPMLFSPYMHNTVKERVEAFEGLTSSSSKGKKISEKAPPRTPTVFKADSPIMKSKATRGQRINLEPCKESPNELSDEDANDSEPCNIEPIAENVEIGDSANKTFQVEVIVEEKLEMEVNENACNLEDQADDEWNSEEEFEEKPANTKKGKKMKKKRLVSSPKVAKPVTLKTTDGSIEPSRSLRSRKVNKSSADFGHAQTTKTKGSNLQSNMANVPIQLQKSMEVIDKEAELKRMVEKEEEALKRKEELMKKKTEAAKRKREEKMAKVKRTREVLEKDAKAKLRKMKADKKKKAEVKAVEVESVVSPMTVQSPVILNFPSVPEKLNQKGTPKQNLNATFDLKTVKKESEPDTYNMTPCWQERPPAQPENPNDYGIVDKSDCSSDEENDPRKKVPDWAQFKPVDRRLLAQGLLDPHFINDYWNSTPRVPTLTEFFGQTLSKRTLTRGLNFRTSSACWNTPPLRKLAQSNQ